MTQRKRVCLWMLMLVMFFFIPSIKADATVSQITITKSKNVVGYKKTLQLKANVTGAVSGDTVTWTSSNTKKAIVDENGKVTGTGGGKVKITASCGGKKATVEILAVRYSPSNGKGDADLAIYYNGNKRRVYRTYDMKDYNGVYGKKLGNAATGTAIVLSGLVNFYLNPQSVHFGVNHYSETYAIKKLGKSYSKYDTMPPARRISTLSSVMPTNFMVNQILKNSGLKTKYVKSVTNGSAQQIYNYLASGNAVIFTTNKNRSYKGITLASGSQFNTLIMAGLDENGKVLLINPANGKINYSSSKKKYFHFTVSEIVKHYIRSNKSRNKTYNGDYNGYILVKAPSETQKVTAMRLTRENLKLEEYDKYSLSAYINPATVDQTVIWTSSNPEVATVSDNGNVTALSSGTAVIKATCVANDKFSSSCNLTVYPKEVDSITVTAPKTFLSYGKTMQLTAKMVGGSKKTRDSLIWYTSNRRKATIDENGVLSVTGGGYVDVTAKVGAKSDTVTILCNRYEPVDLNGDKDVTIYYDGNKTRTYKSYSQAGYNGTYGGHRGCAITATAIVLSGMVDPKITPETLHRGTSKYSERYAINKLANKYNLYDTISPSARINKLDQSTPTNRMLAEILGNAGLKTKYVSQITSSSAQEIYLNLAKGNPVIFTTKSTLKYKGISLAKTWHTLTMVGLDSTGRAIVINPAGGRVNYTHAQHTYFHFTVSEIIKNYERSCSGTAKFYSGSRFGYVIVSQ